MEQIKRRPLILAVLLSTTLAITSAWSETASTDAPPEQAAGAATAQKKRTAKDVVVLTGAPMGGVRLDHKAHAERAGNKCETCHHASKPPKPLAAPQQACSECHTKAATPPMKTKLQAAFHDPTAKSGTCITCHQTQNAKAGKKAPLKCQECHKKDVK